MTHIPCLSTFSIVAYDPQAQEWGIAVQSKFLAVGAVGLVDAQGRAATFTGDECLAWAGGVTGTYYAAQGNILVSGATVEAMAKTFEETRGELADRLVAVLAAGQAAGGDRRGRQSAAVLVVRPEGCYGGYNDRYMDLRVDDDPEPIERLKALVDLHHLFFKPPAPGEMIAIEGDLAREVQHILQWARYYDGPITGEYDAPTRKALSALIGNENFEERFDEEKGLISRQVMDVFRLKFAR